MNLVKKLRTSLPARFDFLLVTIIGLAFSFAMSPSVVESFALTSGDDGPIFPAEVLKNKDFYSKTGISRANNELILMWATITKWFPALLYTYLGIDPSLFHILFVYTQITLIILGTFRLSQSLKFSREVGYVSIALLIIYESYFINMGAYGGQTWMPYTTWIAVGPLLFSWANFLENKKIKALILLSLGTLVHPGMGIVAAILIVTTQNILGINFIKTSRIRFTILVLALVSITSFLTTIPIRHEQFRPIPISWQKLDVGHWAAWNLSNGQDYFQQSKYTIIFTISIMIFATVYRDVLGKIYFFLITAITVTAISVTAQAFFYTFNLRQFSSINFARTTIFSSVLLTIIASKILLVILGGLNKQKISKTSTLFIFTLLFPGGLSLLISNVFMAVNLYKSKQPKKLMGVIYGLIFVVLFFYISNLFDTNKDTGRTFIKDFNLYVPSTLSLRATYAYFDTFANVFILALFILLLYLWKTKEGAKFLSISLIVGLVLLTIFGRFSLSNVRFKENSDWINTQLWAKNNSAATDVFIHTGKYNLYGAWTTLTKRIIIDADSNDGGALYLYSKSDRKYELIRDSIKPRSDSFFEGDEFEKYIMVLAENFGAYYLVSSRVDTKYSFPIVYSNVKYTIYEVAP